MKYLFLILIAFSFVSCETSEETEDSTAQEKPEEIVQGTPEEMAIRHIQSKLSITAIEKYDYTIYKEELNRDDSTDWIITVNLLDRALNEAIKTDKTAKMAELGFMGNFNYIFFMDGKTKKVSPAVVIPSSAKSKLEIGFEYITSETTKDFVVDLKIRNSKRRRFYTIFNDVPLQICEEVLYYNFGKLGTETESYVIEYEEPDDSFSKNILVYEGQLEQVEFENPDDIYTFNPEVKSTGKLTRRWYYNAKHKKYYMKNNEHF